MSDAMPRVAPPAPTSLSRQAQEYLDQDSPYRRAAQPDNVDDIEGWKQYVAAADSAMTSMFGGIEPAQFGVEHTAFEIDGVTTHVLRPGTVTDTSQTPLHLEIHGGGLVLGGGELSYLMALPRAARRPGVTWAIDYRMPPDHLYPAALDDCIANYRQALEERPAHQIVIGGGSAGGNLAAALILRAKDEGLPMPAALILNTPEVDLTESGDSFRTNLGIDKLLGSLLSINHLYAGGHDLAHPYLSPLFGDLSGFPPTLLTTGTRDLYLSNTVRMHRGLLAAGSEAELHVFEAMPHGGFGGQSPEDAELAALMEDFVQRHLKVPA